jgi:hypothetical protein
MSGLKELVESLDGTVLFGGMIVQFSDTTFQEAVKKIYDMGVEAERKEIIAMAESSEFNRIRGEFSPTSDDLVRAIKDRK